MRTAPIQPAELRDFLLKEAASLRERAEVNRNNAKLVASFKAVATEVDKIRKEFLGDLSPTDEPSANLPAPRP